MTYTLFNISNWSACYKRGPNVVVTIIPNMLRRLQWPYSFRSSMARPTNVACLSRIPIRRIVIVKSARLESRYDMLTTHTLSLSHDPSILMQLTRLRLAGFLCQQHPLRRLLLPQVIRPNSKRAKFTPATRSDQNNERWNLEVSVRASIVSSNVS